MVAEQGRQRHDDGLRELSRVDFPVTDRTQPLHKATPSGLPPLYNQVARLEADVQGPTVAMQLQVAEVYKNTNRLETDCIKVRSGDTESKVQKHCHMGRFFLLLLTSSFPTNYKDGDQKLRTKNVSSQVRKRNTKCDL